MELIHNNKAETTLTNLTSWFQKRTSTFIKENSDAFEALTRSGNLFGGNLLPTAKRSKSPRFITSAPEPIERVKQQVDELAQMVVSLSDQVNAIHSSAQPSAKKTRSQSGTKSAVQSTEIGINRFRELQDN